MIYYCLILTFPEDAQLTDWRWLEGYSVRSNKTFSEEYETIFFLVAF